MLIFLSTQLLNVAVYLGGRSRTLKTSFNDKGEEVTEEVWEEGAEAIPEVNAAAAPTAVAGKVGSGGNASKPQTNGKVSAGATKAKGAPQAGGQKGIMSFFGKK